jgi:hypothetical protein
MFDAALEYSLVVVLSAAFGAAYFAWLKSSMDKVLAKKRSPAYMHASFALRLAFAVAFFRVMLFYFPGVWECAAMLATFVAARCLMLKREAVK